MCLGIRIGKNGVLRIWVPGYFRDVRDGHGTLVAGRPWIDFEGNGKLDLYMLSGILTSQMRAERTE